MSKERAKLYHSMGMLAAGLLIFTAHVEDEGLMSWIFILVYPAVVGVLNFIWPTTEESRTQSMLLSIGAAFAMMFGGLLIVGLVFGAIFAFGWAATKLGF